jgi:hypothetical protein
MRGYMSLDGSHRIRSSHMCGGSGGRDTDDHASMNDTPAGAGVTQQPYHKRRPTMQS